MKKSVAIIGGGTAGLFAAAFLDTDKYEVTIYEKKATVGRKFLVAGDGGFNLTHSESINEMVHRYLPESFLQSALESFSNLDFRTWLDKLGIATYIGSSKRVFPKQGIKPIAVLNAILNLMKEKSVAIKVNKSFTGWSENEELLFSDGELVTADFKIFALGGASWKVTGSDGSWLSTFSDKGITTISFQATNCAYEVAWPEEFVDRNEGKPLKNIAIESKGQTQKGEVVVTKYGLEGNAIYALSPELNAQLHSEGIAQIHVDLKPTLSLEVLQKKLNDSQLKTTEKLKLNLKLSSTQIQLIKSHSSKEEFLDTDKLSQLIKTFPLSILSSATIDEAISTSGGLSLDAVTADYELKKIKNTYCIGEMLDWFAPTGGYLVQGCASMGVFVAKTLNEK